MGNIFFLDPDVNIDVNPYSLPMDVRWASERLMSRSNWIQNRMADCAIQNILANLRYLSISRACSRIDSRVIYLLPKQWAWL